MEARILILYSSIIFIHVHSLNHSHDIIENKLKNVFPNLFLNNSSEHDNSNTQGSENSESAPAQGSVQGENFQSAPQYQDKTSPLINDRKSSQMPELKERIVISSNNGVSSGASKVSDKNDLNITIPIKSKDISIMNNSRMSEKSLMDVTISPISKETLETYFTEKKVPTLSTLLTEPTGSTNLENVASSSQSPSSDKLSLATENPLEELETKSTTQMASKAENTSTMKKEFTQEANVSLSDDHEITITVTKNESLVDKNISNRSRIVRKCCEIDTYYNVITHSCEVTNSSYVFNSAVSDLFEGSEMIPIQYKSAFLKSCVGNNEPPSVQQGINSSTHLALNSGEIVDRNSLHSFGQTEYCLELVGIDAENGSLTFVSCFQFDNFEEHLDYHSYTESRREGKGNFDTDNRQIVRKCCGPEEYYNMQTLKCTYGLNTEKFSSHIEELSFENGNFQLEIISGRLRVCQDMSPPLHLPIDSNSFRLLHSGELFEVATGIEHNHSDYCIGMVGDDEVNTILILALCLPLNSLPKCCPNGNYFDEIRFDCLPYPSSNYNEQDLKSQFQSNGMDSSEYSLIPLNGSLLCNVDFPVKEKALNLFLSEGKLCNHISCFTNKEFCVDFVGHINKELVPSAFYCHKDYFVKCCNESFVLNKNGCVPHPRENSVHLQQLMGSRTFVNSFDFKECKNGKTTLLDEAMSSHLIWWVSNEGNYITVQVDSSKQNVHRYCVEDFIDDHGKIGPSAYVCESDVDHLLPSEKNYEEHSFSKSLRKCCRENRAKDHVYFVSLETIKCETMIYNQSLRYNQYLKVASFQQEHYYGFPTCPNDVVGYHTFSFEPGLSDYVEISSEQRLVVVSKSGKCVQRKDIVSDRDYCIEYVLSQEGDLKPAAFLCAYSVIYNVYTEKYVLVTTLLGMSCACLFCTLIYLFTIRVRRGLVSVKKANTLAGKILISFISSHLIGFLALTITQHRNSINEVNSTGCYVLAGFVQFFNLAAFCWNTSICLEALLLAIDISISECARYCLHSIWAWGFPATLTLIMYMIDLYKDDLPCWVIVPNIGVRFCFHADDNATLVYFYIPILLTLVANVAFIIGGRTIRNLKLKRLERGKWKPSKSGQEDGRNGGGTAPSGMRTHQAQRSKKDLLRIVLWTGVTWFMELIGFVLPRYIMGHSSEKWYEYLWYIPTCLNAARGIGIFVIIVITAERKSRIASSFRTATLHLRSLFPEMNLRKHNVSRFSSEGSAQNNTESRKRNMSVTTMISLISTSFYSSSPSTYGQENGTTRKTSIASIFSSKSENLRKTSSNNSGDLATRKVSASNTPSGNRNNKPTRKIGIIRSVSQFDRRTSTSSNNYCLDEINVEDNKRRSSVPLPKLQEEESTFDRDEEIRSTIEEEDAIEKEIMRRDENDKDIKLSEEVEKPVVFSAANEEKGKSSSLPEEYEEKNESEEITSILKGTTAVVPVTTSEDSDFVSVISRNPVSVSSGMEEKDIPGSSSTFAKDKIENSSKSLSFREVKSDKPKLSPAMNKNRNDNEIKSEWEDEEDNVLEINSRRLTPNKLPFKSPPITHSGYQNESFSAEGEELTSIESNA